MASDGTRSLQEIRRDTERTREGLTTSVNELREAVTETASDPLADRNDPMICQGGMKAEQRASTKLSN